MLKERNQKVQSYFQKSAEQFDKLYHKTGFFAYTFNKLFRKALYKRSQLTLEECLNCSAKSVLDIGCGSGVNSVLLAENGIEQVTGIDYADGMLDIAREKSPSHLKNRIEYIKADFIEWNTQNKYDCSIALGVFDYLDKPKPFLDKMYTLSKKKVIFSAPGKGNIRQIIRSIRYRFKKCPLYFYSKNDLITLMKIYKCKNKIINIGSSGFLCVIDKM